LKHCLQCTSPVIASLATDVCVCFLAELLLGKNSGHKLLGCDGAVRILVHLQPGGVGQPVLRVAFVAALNDTEHVLDKLPKLGFRNDAIVVHVKNPEYPQQILLCGAAIEDVVDDKKLCDKT